MAPYRGARFLPWFSLALFTALIVPRLFQRGQFLDGVTYSAISRNLAQGIGSFWSPHYTQTLYPRFTEHPPLAFALQSVPYRLLGDHFWIDAVWSMLLGVIFSLVFAALSRRLHIRRHVAWGGGFFLLLVPLTSWVVQNNLLELSLGVFTLTATLLALPSATTGPARRSLFLVGAGLCVSAGFLCKGPPALFPLAVPLLARLAALSGTTRQRLIDTVVLMATVGGIASALWWYEPSRLFFSDYFSNQVLRSLAGQRELASSRAHLVVEWAAAMAIPGTVVVLALVWSRWRRPGLAPRTAQKRTEEEQRAHRFLWLAALAASLPLLASPKQMSWYLFPSLPFYALAFAILCFRIWLELERWLSARRRRGGTAILLALAVMVGSLAVAVRQWGQPRRQEDLFGDVARVRRESFPARAIFAVCQSSLLSDWGLHAVLQRELGVSLAPPSPTAPYRLFEVGPHCPVPPECTPLQAEGVRRYRLMKCGE